MEICAEIPVFPTDALNCANHFDCRLRARSRFARCDFTQRDSPRMGVEADGRTCFRLVLAGNVFGNRSKCSRGSLVFCCSRSARASIAVDPRSGATYCDCVRTVRDRWRGQKPGPFRRRLEAVTEPLLG